MLSAAIFRRAAAGPAPGVHRAATGDQEDHSITEVHPAQQIPALHEWGGEIRSQFRYDQSLAALNSQGGNR